MTGAKRPRGRGRWRGRQHARRTGMVALALVLGTAGGALTLAFLYHFGVAATLVVILGGLPGLYLAWAAYRDSQAVGGTLAGVADQLAVAVGAQWETEAAVRRLNDPYPLPVSWAAADKSLTDDWDVLLRLATSGAGWPMPPPPDTWAASPECLAGIDNDLAKVFRRVPTGRLVVLGEPGAGKTMLMVRLLLDLLAQRASGGQVPVLASLASWNPEGQDLHEWLADELTIDHPALAAPAPRDAGEATCIQALLAAHLILPILDGLDEIPDAARGPMIIRINDSLRPGEPLVVTCRTEPYRDAVRAPLGAEVTLRGAAAVQLRPLDTDAVAHYLRDDAGGPGAAARWDPVLATLGTQAPAGQALTTPLMVELARTVYNPRLGERAGHLRDPAELCSPALANQASVERRLFDGFIPATYRPLITGRWTAQQAETWLVFLARHLENTINSPDLAWWQLQRAAPLAPLSIGVAALGAALGAAVVGGLLAWLAAALAACFFGAAVWGWKETKPSQRVVASAVGLTPPLAATLAIGLAAGPILLAAGRAAYAWYGFTLVLGLGLGYLSGLSSVPENIEAATNPRAVLVRDRRAVLVIGLVFAVFCLVIGAAAGLATASGVGLVIGAAGGAAVGLLFGAAVGLLISGFEKAWPSYMLARVWLTMRGQLPWSLPDFLADAHQRGVLRQAGAVYQFRHIELQHRLATRP